MNSWGGGWSRDRVWRLRWCSGDYTYHFTSFYPDDFPGDFNHQRIRSLL